MSFVFLFWDSSATQSPHSLHGCYGAAGRSSEVLVSDFAGLWGEKLAQLSACRAEATGGAPRGARSLPWAGWGSLGMSLGAHLHACMSFILCSAGAKEDLRSLSMENSLEDIYGYNEKVSMAFERRKCFNGGQDFDRLWERQQGPVNCGWSWDCDRCVYWSSVDPGTSQKIQ